MTPLPLLGALSLVSATLTTLSLPSFNLGLLGWCALAMLLFALRQRGLAAGAALGALYGCGLGAGSFFWINVIPDISALRFALLVAAFSLYYMAFGFAYALVNRRFGSWMIVGAPILWVTFEYARGSLSFLAYPWNFLGHSQHQFLPVIQIADLTGAYGVSFVLVMANQFLSELPDILRHGRAWRRQGAALAVVLVGTLFYGWHRLLNMEVPAGTVRVALVQANVAPRTGMSMQDRIAHLAEYGRLTAEAAQHKPDFIVWPSSSLPGPIGFSTIRRYVNGVAHRAGVPLLVGGVGGDKFAPAREGFLPYSNSQFLISPQGKLQGQYNKIRLTPFTEEVPLQGTVQWPLWITTMHKSFTAGDQYTLFEVGSARFGAPICWENSFPDVFRRFVLEGANFMVSATNESVFGATSGPYQTLAMNAFRAVENRVAIARVATTGVSAFIDSRGRIVSRVQDASGADFNIKGTLAWDAPLYEKKTFYTRYGDVFAWTACVAAVLLSLGSLVSPVRLTLNWRKRMPRAP